MFGLNSTGALAFFVLLLLMIIIFVLYILYFIFSWFFKKNKLKNNGDKLIGQMLIDSEIPKIIIGRRKHITIVKTYKKDLRMVILSEKFYIKNNYFIAYDSLLIFNNLFQMENQQKNVFRWLRIISYFFVFSIFLFVVNIILIIINKFSNSIDFQADLYVQYFSFIGVFFLVMSWFSWVAVSEKLREKVLQLATHFLTPQETKKIKILSTLKTVVPLSNNFFY